MIDSNQLEKRYETVLARVQAASERGGRHGAEVTVVAVSKTFSVERIEALYELGHRDFGENKVQELKSKQSHMKETGSCPDIRWHLIGTLQRNKVRQIAGSIHMFHALDRIDLASEFEKRSVGSTVLDCFLQVNISREASKHGFHLEEVPGALEQIGTMSSIRLVGLMGMAATAGGERQIRNQFAELRRLLETLGGPSECRYLSMGMSQDYELAIEEGATHVRIGSGIFGPRVYPGTAVTTSSTT